MKRGLLIGMGLVLVGGVVTPAVTPMGAYPAAAVTSSALPFDFDGDGYADMAVGVPGEDIGSIRGAGAAQVLYGSSSGPTARDQFWHQNKKGIKGGAEPGDGFGSSIASGDFDADGYADLAVGIPREDLGGQVDTGAVQVLYGAPGGLTARDQVWHQDRAGVPGKNEAGDLFGYSMQVGDFQGDGYADLAINVPGKRFDGIDRSARSGVIVVLNGSAGGLTAAGAQSWSPWNPATAGPEQGIVSGPMGFAVGQFTGDSRDDLAILAHDGTYVEPRQVGAFLLVLAGSADGLTASNVQSVPLGDTGVEVAGNVDGTQYLFTMGSSGDFDGNGLDDLSLLSRDSDSAQARTLVVLYAAADGFTAAAAQLWHLHAGVPTVVDTAESYDPALHCTQFATAWFGMTNGLAAGDLTGDGVADLAVPAEATYDMHSDPVCSPVLVDGQVHLLLGSASGLTATSSALTQDTEGVPGATERGDLFGLSSMRILANRDGGAWLAIRARDEALGRITGAGSVTVVPGSAQGWVPTSSRAWHQNKPGIKGAAEKHDAFGQL